MHATSELHLEDYQLYTRVVIFNLGILLPIVKLVSVSHNKVMHRDFVDINFAAIGFSIVKGM